MARHKKWTTAARHAFAARMARFRKKKHVKRKIKHIFKRAKHIIRHPIKAYRHHRYSTPRVHHVKQRIPWEYVAFDAMGLGLITAAFTGGQANVPAQTVPAPTTVTSPTTPAPTSAPGSITYSNTYQSQYGVYDVTINGYGFSRNGIVKIYVASTQVAQVVATSTGTMSYSFGASPGTTYVVYTNDNTTGVNSNTLTISIPAAPTTVTTTTTTTTTPSGTSTSTGSSGQEAPTPPAPAPQKQMPTQSYLTPQQATQILSNGGGNLGSYGNTSQYQGAGIYADAAGNLFYLTSAAQFPPP